MTRYTTRWTMLGAALLMALANLAHRSPVEAQETGIDGNVFTSEEYGWSLEFDEDRWSARDFPHQGGIRLLLTPGNGDAITVTFDVEANGITDAEECLEDIEDGYASGRLENFEASDDYEAPESDPDAFGVYSAHNPDADIEGDAVYYLECRELSGATLGIAMGGEADLYEEYLPAFEELLIGLTIDQSANDAQDDKDEDDIFVVETGLDGSLFLDLEVGYQVDFDGSVWEADKVRTDGQPALLLVIEDDPSYATVWIDGQLGYEDISPEDCVDAYADTLEDSEGYSDIEVADDLPLFETDRNAEAQVYRFVFTTEDDEETDHIGYVECRQAGDDGMVRIFITTDVDSYQDETAVFEELLADIEVLDANDSTDAEDESSDRDDEEEQEFGGLYNDPEDRWSLQYDDEVWGLDEVDEPALAGAELYPLDENVFGFVSMFVSENGPPTALECLQSAQESFAESRVFLDFEPAEDIDEPETIENAFNGIYRTTFAGESSEVDLIFYLECREIEDGVLSIAMAVDEELFEDYLPEWERLLAGISPGDGSS